MGKFKFATGEFCFPTWGSLSFEMAKEAGFDGIEITDGGGYIQVHPLAKGYVEYERMGLDLRRLDSYPLSDAEVREYYLEAAERTGLEIMGINLVLLNSQGFAKAAPESLAGKEYKETVRVAAEAAAKMGIGHVSVPVKGMFGTAQNTYALQKLQYAREIAKENGVEIFIYCDQPIERQLKFYEELGGEVKFDFFTIDPEVCAWGDPWDYEAELSSAEKRKGSKGLCVPAIKAFGDRIGQFRVKDLGADEEGILTMESGKQCLMGEGDVDFESVAAAIKESGYEGWIIVDNKYFRPDVLANHPGDDYVSLAAKDVRALRGFFE